VVTTSFNSTFDKFLFTVALPGRHGFFIKVAERKLDIEAFDTTGHIFDHITVP
jgi:hypothetical protein